MAKKKPEKKTPAKVTKKAAAKPTGKKVAAKKPAAKKPVAKASTKPAAKTTKKPATKVAKKPVAKKKPAAAEALQLPPPPSPTLNLGVINPNPDFPHNIDVKISGYVTGTTNAGISWTIRRNGAVVAAGNAAAIGIDSFEFTIPANTLSNNINDYTLEVTKAGVSTATVTLDTTD